jgi:hypothetical protein
MASPLANIIKRGMAILRSRREIGLYTSLSELIWFSEDGS